MNRTILIVALALAGCAKPKVEAPVAGPEHYRPAWAFMLFEQAPALRACVDGRAEPRFVVFIEPLSKGTGVSTVDALGAVEHCVWDAGHVVRREPTRLSREDFAGLPVFSLGPDKPFAHAPEALEPVFDDQEGTLGWLYWPPGDVDESPSDPALAASGAEVTP